MGVPDPVPAIPNDPVAAELLCLIPSPSKEIRFQAGVVFLFSHHLEPLCGSPALPAIAETEGDVKQMEDCPRRANLSREFPVN